MNTSVQTLFSPFNVFFLIQIAQPLVSSIVSLPCSNTSGYSYFKPFKPYPIQIFQLTRQLLCVKGSGSAEAWSKTPVN